MKSGRERSQFCCLHCDLVVILLVGVLWPAMFLLEKATFLEPLQSSFSARLPPTVQNMPESSSRNSPRVRENQSKFDFNCAVDLTPIQLLVVSDRQDNKTPLLGFVNSILMYTSHPVHLHIVTRQTAIPWVDSLESEYFHVTYHLTPLAYSKLIASRTNFKTDHYSSVFAMVKLFIPTLSFAEGISKVLVLDDDMVFYRDLYPLYELVQTKPHQLSLFCPEDSRRVETYYTRKNMTGNGHPTRYCISGMMGIPVQPQDKIVDLFENTLANMNRDYPGHIYSVADQDVVNRAFADHHDKIDLIPCQWSCDSNSCMKRNGPCSNCNMTKPGQCYSYHFLGRSQDIVLGHVQWEWSYYFHQNQQHLLHSVYLPRVNQTCNGIKTKEATAEPLHLDL